MRKQSKFNQLFTKPQFVIGGAITCAVFILLIVVISIIRQDPSQPQQSVATASLPTLTGRQYNTLEEEYAALTKAKGPREAVSHLKRMSETDSLTLRYCHELMHRIGKEAFYQTGDFAEAIKYKDDGCTSGYIHGVLQAYFDEAEDMMLAMKDVCSGYTKNSFIAWECYHGIGHGLMYFTGNDLPQAIKGCEVYEVVGDRSACLNGAYMENFAADEEDHPTKFRKKTDYFYPCNEQQEKYKQDCYQNAVIYYLSENEEQYDKALDWCSGAEELFRDICYQSVGSQATRRHIDNISLVESACSNKQPENKRLWCVSGIASYYVSHYASATPAKKMCGELKKENRSFCEQTIKALQKTHSDL